MNELCLFTSGTPESLNLLNVSAAFKGLHLHSYSTPWTDYVDVKLRKGLTFLKTRQEPLAMWLDGHDSLVLKSERSIVSKFWQFDAPIVFSGERTCWPDADMAPQYGYTDPGKLYLNAGGFMGVRIALIMAMEKALALATDGDDQRAWTKYYLAHRDHVAIDHDRILFSSVADGIDGLNADSCTKHWNGKLPGREHFWLQREQRDTD